MATIPERPRVAGIILAAGQSTRLGRPKQLLDLGGKTVIRRIAEAATETPLAPVIVVTGNAADLVEGGLAGLDILVVFNPDYATGQASSMRVGLEAVPADADAVLFLLGDQPTISRDLITAVLDRYRETGAPIVQCRYRSRTGHPVLVARALFPELLEVGGDQGARSVIRRHADSARYAEIDQDDLPDIDTPADYERILVEFSEAQAK